MKTPFPGMDPYLEHPVLWADVHDSLIGAIRDALVPLVAPNYFVGMQRHAYLVMPDDNLYLGIPDVTIGKPPLATSNPPASTTATATAAGTNGVGVLEVQVPTEQEVEENYLEVREVKTNRLITVIEILSPVNKSHTQGRQEYIQKRKQIFTTYTNLVEIDLLRSGQPMTVYGADQTTDYRILISPGWRRPDAQLYAFNVRQSIPSFPLPLLPDDELPDVHLNQILHELYTRARFDLRLDYSAPPKPKLAQEDAEWAAALISKAAS